MTRDIIKYRLARADDVQFIIRTWIDSYKGAHGAGMLQIPEFALPLECDCGRVHPIRYDFSAVMEVTLAQVLQRPGVTTWAAHNPRERAPHDLYGYLVWEKDPNVPSWAPSGKYEDGKPVYKLEVVTSDLPLVHFCFVKQTYRHLGLARALFKVAGLDPTAPYLYSCKTSNVSKLEKAGVMPRARWFPLSARFPKDKREKST